MKDLFKKYSWVLAIFLLMGCSEEGIDESGTGTISGTVVSEGDNIPLANVKISTTPVTNTVFTDEAGKFIIENVTEREYSVQAQLEGYLTAFKAANVQAGATSNVVFELQISTANNKPPGIPILISPAENEILQTPEANFVWSATDPDDDKLTFTLELRNDQNNTVEKFENLTDTTLQVSSLMLGAKYFWQVTADDDINAPVISPVSTFRVFSAPIDNRFLFVRNIAGNNVIFSTDEAGNEFQLTSSSNNSFRPRKNIAAGKIAYMQTTGAQVDIFTMDLDGNNKFKVTSSVKPNGFNLNEINYSWPANSDQIYFPAFDKLYRINTNGQGLTQVYQTTDGSFISEVDVSENSNLIALKTNNQNGYNISIFTIDFSGNILHTILSGVNGASSGLNLSVTNQKVLYSYDVSGFENANYRRLDSRIFIYDIPTSTATEVLTDKPGGTNDLEPRFSPNEAEVIFTNTSNDGISQKNIYKLLISGSANNRTLLFNNAFMPDWE